MVFSDSVKVYNLDWTELLTADNEIPFESLEDVKTGLTIMAPWTDGSGNIRYAEAKVVSPGKRSS